MQRMDRYKPNINWTSNGYLQENGIDQGQQIRVWKAISERNTKKQWNNRQEWLLQIGQRRNIYIYIYIYIYNKKWRKTLVV